MSKKVISFIIACILCILIVPIGVQAESVSDLKDQLEENKQDQKQVIKKIDANKASIQDLEDEINELNKDIKAVEKEIDNLNGQIGEKEKEMDQIQDELDAAVKEKDEQKETLDERIRVMYMYSDTSYLEILFSSKDFSDLISKVYAIKTIAQQDQEIFAELEKLEQEINAKKEKIETEKAVLENLKSKTLTKKNGLAQVKASRQGYQQALEQKRAKLQKELDNLESESNSLKSEIVNLQTIDDDINEGTYKWPVPGYAEISSYYGWRSHPVTHLPNFHTGIDIPTSRRTGVSALATGYGEVIQSTYSSGYGNKVTLDLGLDSNGNRVSAVYAHLNKRYVSVGQKVSPGTPVGEIGTTGTSTGIHLHFEIRINGDHKNPLNYVAR